MDIGRVLLRDAHYVWRERVAVLEKDAVVLQSPPSAWQAAASAIARPKKTKPKLKQKPKLIKQRSKPKAPPPAELLPLDGSLSCEGVVVSSAHMHSVRLQDLRSGREFLVDATTKGKKQMWIDLFASARSRANIDSSWRGEVPLVDVDVEMLVAATESDSEAAVLRGHDVEEILLGDGSAADFTEKEVSVLRTECIG
ncbi:Transmembrane protein [Phytophthora palmivora]|uniref:Transmembrane protein n=1 Tax=Phytophthora palmivora TaxID=4796 RepID=A0A2P4XX17_9STRA|nr:Transmembrane protein [Phytophthora palmivora]